MGPGSFFLSLSLLPQRRDMHTHTHTHYVHTPTHYHRIVGVALPPPPSEPSPPIPSAFDPVDLRSSHGATLAVAGVRMPKGDGRDHDASGGRRTRWWYEKREKEVKETVGKRADLVWKEEG